MVLLNQRLYLVWTNAKPSSIKQALSHPQWKKAMNQKFESLMKINAWSLVSKLPHMNIVGNKWVFWTKQNSYGVAHRFKAHLVAKGFHQKSSFDFYKPFSLVIKPVVIRFALTLAITTKWCIKQVDFNNTFLNGYLQEIVYMD